MRLRQALPLVRSPSRAGRVLHLLRATALRRRRLLAEISVQPQVGRDIRPEVTRALEEIEHAGMRYEVEPFGTVVEGDLEQILAALRSIHGRFSAEGIERFELHVRVRQEPDEASIERETEGFRGRSAGRAEGMPGLEP